MAAFWLPPPYNNLAATSSGSQDMGWGIGGPEEARSTCPAGERGPSPSQVVSLEYKSPIWETHHLKAKFTNVVHHEGYIYGLDDGILVCLDLTNGQRKWKRGRYGHGQIILVNNLLLIQAESGEIVLVGADPTAHKELSRFAALDGRTWNNPALSGPYLLVRNDQEAACYLLPVGE